MKNREIKFRVWNEEIKEMQNVISLWHRSDGTIPHVGVALDEDYMDVDTLFKCYKLMQFTGLNDKNGKDIYEADILQDVSNSENPLYIIEWNNEICQYNDIPRDSSNYPCTYKFEVIGNIHENNELLNG